MAKKTLTRAEKIILFIERYLFVPEGDRVGRPVVLEDFQKKFIYAVYDNPTGTRKAILSMARKNSKTTFIAMLAIVHLVGPEAKLNSRISSGALSRQQAAEVFTACHKMLNFSPDLRKLVRVIPSQKQIIGLFMNVTYQALSAEGKSNMGGSPILAILDETGQVVGTRDLFIDAVVTSQGAYDTGALLIVISTQAASDSDLLSVWIDDAKKSEDPKIVCHVYEGPEGCDVMDEKAWYAANPALGKFRSINDLRSMAEQASRMPSFESTFRNLYLNQRVSTVSPFITRGVWKENAGKIVPPSEWEAVYGGLDLSARNDLTAFVLFGPHEGRWHIQAHFWMAEAGLMDKAKRDRAPYDLWVKQGYLKTTPGASIDYDWVATEVAEITSSLEVTSIGFDRWRIDVFKAACERLGIELPLEPFGQGYRDMAPAIDMLEEKLLNRLVNHGENPVLTMCFANASINKDPAGNRKLDKTKTSGRIDGAVATAMAAGVAERQHEENNLDDFLRDVIVVN